MALTLPYPGLVFVPLDVLTAEEQNKIVANYTYIANQFPVTASNIDLNSMPSSTPKYTNWTSISSLPYTSDNYYSITATISGGKAITVNSERVMLNENSGSITGTFTVRPGDVIGQAGSGSVTNIYKMPLSYE